MRFTATKERRDKTTGASRAQASSSPAGETWAFDDVKRLTGNRKTKCGDVFVVFVVFLEVPQAGDDGWEVDHENWIYT